MKAFDTLQFGRPQEGQRNALAAPTAVRRRFLDLHMAAARRRNDTRHALDAEHMERVGPAMRLFVCRPCAHSEEIADHGLCVAFHGNAIDRLINIRWSVRL